MTPPSGFLLLVSVALLTCHSAGKEDPEAVLNSADDYDYYLYTEPPDEPANSSRQLSACDYDHCRDQQTPCMELAVSTGCRCPGQSGPNEPPEAPVLLEVTREGSRVAVHWCAPASTVTHYHIMEGQHHLLTTSKITRRAWLPELQPGAKVCVTAVNKVGSSSPSKSSCTRYELAADSLSTAGWIVGGVLAFVLLLLLALVAFLLRRSKAGSRPTASNPSHSDEAAL